MRRRLEEYLTVLQVFDLFAIETFAGVEIARDCSPTSGFSPWRIGGVRDRSTVSSRTERSRDPGPIVRRDKVRDGSRTSAGALSGMTAAASRCQDASTYPSRIVT